jgi:hypothetical protein
MSELLLSSSLNNLVGTGRFDLGHHFSNLGIQAVLGLLLKLLEFGFVVLFVPLSVFGDPVGGKQSNRSGGDRSVERD